MPYILALDQGTTSSRALVFDRRGRVLAQAQQEFPQHYPRPGWVEHAPEDLWESTRRVAITAIADANLRYRRCGDYQPTRDHAAVESHHRKTDRTGDRLAGPAHGFALYGLEKRGA